MLERPSFAEEKRFAAQGYRRCAGIDEVGRGALAGPVVAAAVILPEEIDAKWLAEVNDSKLITPPKREVLYKHITQIALAIGVGIIPPDLIDTNGILKATRLAMKQAIAQIVPPPQSLLIDYIRLPEVPLPQKGITSGDRKCLSIACASIIAKVTRDRLMAELDGTYPGYGFARNKGYGTREHLACLQRLGASPIHRSSFSPVKEMLFGLLS